MNKPKQLPILLVDDDPDFREVLKNMLVRSHFSVILAASGNEAYEILEQRKATYGDAAVKLVISDWQMPGGDGLAFLSRIRSGSHSTVPFLLMSGAVTREELLQAARSGPGPDAVLLKPPRVDDLFKIIDNLTNRAELNLAIG